MLLPFFSASASLLGSLAFIAFTVAAEQTPLLHNADHHNRSVSYALYADLEELARIVDIAYCVGSTSWGISKPFQCLSRCSDFPHFELVTTWNTGPLLSDSCGYIALDHGKKRIVVAFRGTYSIANTIVDLSTVPQKYVPYPGEGSDGDGLLEATNELKCADCTVHMGFHASWLNTRKQILPEIRTLRSENPTYRLILVGHSLGGAVAALAGLDLLARGYSPTVTTFGEPRIGNSGLVKYLDARFNLTHPLVLSGDTMLTYRRVTHVDDPVPLLPLTEWGYAMHAGEIFISKPTLSPDIADLRHCKGDDDDTCIAGQDSTLHPDMLIKPDLMASVMNEIQDVKTESWGIPSRYRLWQLFFAHRDYFWRLGLCLPGGDPLGGGANYGTERHDL